MRGLTESLWPIRYKPLSDELLSSWLVRLAHGHGLKVQTFCNLIFGNKLQVWNRDIDRLAPEWLIAELSSKTGASYQQAFKTTLQSYQGIIYHRPRQSGSLTWIQSLKLHHRKFEGFGLQFCPMCLASDPEPYFRKSWRVAFNTTCPIHQCMLQDRCPHCGHGVAFHRSDMKHAEYITAISLLECHYCGFDLSQTPLRPPSFFDNQIGGFIKGLSTRLASSTLTPLDIENLMVMHHFSKLMLSRSLKVRLYSHLCFAIGVDEIVLNTKDDIEGQDINARHHLMQAIFWLMLDLENRLRSAILNKVTRYNHLKKDFGDAPKRYLDLIEKFSDWRSQIML
jgi:hypothetical protein